jgi:hypothetical protein
MLQQSMIVSIFNNNKSIIIDEFRDIEIIVGKENMNHIMHAIELTGCKLNRFINSLQFNNMTFDFHFINKYSKWKIESVFDSDLKLYGPYIY